MTARIYANYGGLACKGNPVYTATPGSDPSLCDAMDIDIPDEYVSGRNAVDELLVAIDGRDYLLSELLREMLDNGDSVTLRAASRVIAGGYPTAYRTIVCPVLARR